MTQLIAIGQGAEMTSVIDPAAISCFHQADDECHEALDGMSRSCSMTEFKGVGRNVLYSHPSFDIDASEELRVATFAPSYDGVPDQRPSPSRACSTDRRCLGKSRGRVLALR